MGAIQMLLANLGRRQRMPQRPKVVRLDAAIRFLFILVLMAALGGVSPGQIVTPKDARKLGLESLRLAIQKDGGVPLPENLDEFIRDRSVAIQLGKALFWEMQVGSDGIQSCASCHFKGGVDGRTKNELSPGMLRVKNQSQGDGKGIGYYFADRDPDDDFEFGGPNHVLTADDFPFIRAPEQLVILPNGTVEPDVAKGNRNDISDSQGVFYTYYYNTIPGYPYDIGKPISDQVFNVSGLNTRRVEQRNAPQIFNSVLNFTNFWDGRANNHFNGATPFGQQDATARIYVDHDGTLIAVTMDLENASLASQAVGPPTSFFEMSYGNGVDNFRIFPEIGRKLLDPDLVPLGQQLVDPTDSVLGRLSNYPRAGLKEVNYRDLIRKAFAPKYWAADQMVVFTQPTFLPMPSEHGCVLNGLATIINPAKARPYPADQCFTQMEANFSMFFGLAIMLYESTQVTGQSPFDTWMETGRFNKGFGTRELAGLNVFAGKGLCINCHEGPEFTAASVRAVKTDSAYDIMNIDGPPGIATYDTGFFNTAVTPTTDDLGRGGQDPFGRPLGFSEQFAFKLFGVMNIPFPLQPLPDPLVDEDGNRITPRQAFNRLANDGAFKTATVRESELTGPYFHNGGVATLHQLVNAYNHGQNFRQFNHHDVDVNIQDLGLTEQEKDNLVAFLISLTDPRARSQSAPFDHPQLYVPNGHPGNENWVKVNYDRQAKDRLLLVSQVGAAGDPDQPIQTFLKLNPYDDNPVGKADAYATRKGIKLQVRAPGVLANDTSAIGKPLTAVLSDGVEHGTLTLNRDGSFMYCPQSGFTGTDRFSYVAVTDTFDSTPTIVTLTVKR